MSSRNTRTAILLASAVTLAAPIAASADPVKNIVLVHGAWVDGSGWRSVYDILTADGFNVSMVQEPETSFADDFAAAKRVLDRQDGPTLLVGHSYGGSIITEAGVHPAVVGLVYVAAHAPDIGESEGALGKKTPSVLGTTEGAIRKTRTASPISTGPPSSPSSRPTCRVRPRNSRPARRSSPRPTSSPRR